MIEVFSEQHVENIFLYLRPLFIHLGKSLQSCPRGEKGFILELRLCREFAEMNDGAIEATSEVGLESAFKVLLPLSKSSKH
jgi:signal transduction histidine kinase